MVKIVIHPYFIKAKKVVDSCETWEQLKAAKKFGRLAAQAAAKQETTDLREKFLYEDKFIAYLRLCDVQHRS